MPILCVVIVAVQFVDCAPREGLMVVFGLVSELGLVLGLVLRLRMRLCNRPFYLAIFL